MRAWRWLAACSVLACGARTELYEVRPGDAGADVRPRGPGPRQLALGNEHSCLLIASDVYCWGTNAHGELGNGMTTSSSVPLLVQGFTPPLAIASGEAFDAQDPPNLPARGSHTCVLLADDSVTCWGANIAGEWNDTPPAVAVATLVPTPEGLVGVASLGVGGFQSCVVRSTGTVSCWGTGPLGDGAYYSSPHGPVDVVGIQYATAAAASENAVCVLRKDASVWCWGYDGIGQLGDGRDGYGVQSLVPVEAQVDHVVQISAGWGGLCATRNDGAALCWGDDEYGQIGNGVVANDLPVPTVVSLSDVKQVTTSGNHACALRVDGTVWCWGSGLDGRLGIGPAPDIVPMPTKVALDGVVEIASGWRHTCARRMDDSVWCWGRNDAGEVGDGTTENRSTPTQVRLP